MQSFFAHQAFVHVSTTYCNTDRKIIDEKLYPPHANWRTLLAAAEKLDPTVIDLITPKLVSIHFLFSALKSRLKIEFVTDSANSQTLTLLLNHWPSIVSTMSSKANLWS